ncbi:MAG: ribonuclease R [Proteobacteria bacterium]|nr:ribonuclease R [Pseudomonadota bacterium]
MKKIKKNRIRDNDPKISREKEIYPNPIPSRELILDVMNKHGVPLKKNELSKLLDIAKDEEIFFEKRLNAMARQGQIMINRKDVLCVAKKINLIPGRVLGHHDGFGFLIAEDSSSPDIFLSPKEMSKVFNNDRVMVQVTGIDKRGRQEGIIVEVLERANAILVGRVIQNHGVTIVSAEDKRITQDIIVPYNEDMNAKPGQVVEVVITVQPNFRVKPMGKIIKILGSYADSGIEIEIALRKYHLPYEFPKEALHEAEKFNDAVLSKNHGQHRDLTKMNFVTIDGETAKDFDDAVFAEPLEDNIRLLVAIADVSSYVRMNSALDQEALNRGNSIYFPRRVIPMLPEKLSNGLCSLNPKVNRLTMVCDMLVNSEGQVINYKFYPAIINSKARLTYTIVNEILFDHKPELVKEYKALSVDLENLKNVYDRLLGNRTKRGAIEFDSVETNIVFDENGKINYIHPVKRNEAHRIIEECMLAANVSAANFLLKDEEMGIFRNHESPKDEKLENLRTFISEFGLYMDGGDKPSPKDFTELLKKIETRPDSHLLQTIVLRSMQQAVYSNTNKGHFGLSYDAYTHFTSPIRRYPDLMVHRAIKHKILKEKFEAKGLSTIAEHCSVTERRADEASRDVQDWLKCYFMQDKIGQVFNGTISSVTGFGLFVDLDDIYIEALVHVTELGNDYYTYDKNKHAMIGERTKKIYRLGDRIKVKVMRVDMDSSRIDLSLDKNFTNKTLKKNNKKTL